VFMNIAG